MGFGFKFLSCGSYQTPQRQRINYESVGPLEIICSSYMLLRDHAETSACILLTIVVPAAIAMLLNHSFFYAIAHKFLPYPRPPPDEAGPDTRLLIFIGVALLVLGFALTVNLVAATFYVVSVVYTGGSITFKDVLRALPRQWKGIAVTGLWGGLFFIGTGLVLIISQILIMMFVDVSRIPLSMLIILTFTVSRALFFFVVTILEMAFAVTVFEGVDGFRAFSRSWKLLKHKWFIALGIFVIVEVPKILFGDVLSLFPKLSLDLKIVLVLLVVLLVSLLTLLGSVSYALFYKSCDSIVDDENLYSKLQFQTG